MAIPPNKPLSRTSQAFILSALRLVGSLRSGQKLSAAELTDSLQVLNDMVDAWAVKRVLIYSTPYTTVDQNGATLSLIANQAKYTLGNQNGTENFIMSRPPRIQNVSVLYSASQSQPVEIPMVMLDEIGWQGVPNKTTTSLLPQECYVEATQDGTDWLLYFWPVPTQANPVVIYPWAALSQFPDLATPIFLPPGYARAIRYNLAVNLAAEFPCDTAKLPLVIKLAGEFLNDIAAVNIKAKEAWCDPAIVGSGGPRGNIFTGSPSRSHGF